MLGALGDLAAYLEQVAALEGLEPEILVLEVPLVDDGGVEAILVLLNDLVVIVGDHGDGLAGLGVLHVEQVQDDVAELFLGFLVQVGHGNPEQRWSFNVLCYTATVCSSIADPDPESVTFLTPGSRIGFFRIPDLGSQTQIFESLFAIFWVKSWVKSL